MEVSASMPQAMWQSPGYVCDTVASGCGSGGSSSREAKLTSAGIKRERETPEAGDTSHVFPAGVFPVFILSPWPGQGNKD